MALESQKINDINILENVKKNLANLFLNDGYSNVNIVFEKGSNKGDGYVASVVRALMTGEKNEQKRNADVIVKCAKSNPEVRKFVAMTQMFCREVFFYKNIIPYYRKIQTEKSIPEDLKCDFVNCVSSSDKYLEEYVALENMKVKGYALGDKADYLHTEKAFQMLAKLHGLSMIFEKEYKKEFDYAVDYYEGFLKLNSFKEYDSSGFRVYLERSATRLLDSIENEAHRRILGNAMGKSVCEKFSQLTSTSKRKVITHGDFWLNNMFFKYQNDATVKVLPVDFQLARYESPMNDFLTFFGATSEAYLRRSHFWELFDVYYVSLKTFVAACGYDIDEFYSYEDMKKELQDQAVFVFCVTVFLLPFLTSYEDEVVEPYVLFTGKYPNSFLYENKIFKERVNDLVTDFVAFGLLK